jgi:hypothetical protein
MNERGITRLVLEDVTFVRRAKSIRISNTPVAATVGKKVNKKAATATSKYWSRELNKLNQETLGKKTFASIKRFAKQAALAAQKIKNKKARSARKKPAGKKTK